MYRHSLLAGILQFSRCRVPAVVESKTDWSCKTEFWHSITNTIRPRSRYSPSLLQLLIPYFYYLLASVLWESNHGHVSWSNCIRAKTNTTSIVIGEKVSDFIKEGK